MPHTRVITLILRARNEASAVIKGTGNDLLAIKNGLTSVGGATGLASKGFAALKTAAIAAAVAGIAVLGVAVVSLAASLVHLSVVVDQAHDKIRIMTGETGANLDALKKDFEAVVSSVPTDFNTAADAISGIHQRLGITGKG